jgi:hypothetical protein
MSEKKDGGGLVEFILIVLGLGFIFQREQMDKAASNVGRFIGSIILLGVQRQQQNPETQYVPIPRQTGAVESGFTPAPAGSYLNANPYSGSSFKYTPPPKHFP